MAKRATPTKKSTAKPAPFKARGAWFVTIATIVATVGIFWAISATYSHNAFFRYLYLERAFGIAALLVLFASLYIAPFCQLVQRLSIWPKLYRLRRPLALAAVWFTMLHAWVSVFGELGGWNGVGFLNVDQRAVLGVGIVAMIIFLVSAVTTFQGGPDWKWLRRRTLLHRGIYLVSGMVAIQAVTFAAQIGNFDRYLATANFILLVGLLLLEMPRILRRASEARRAPLLWPLAVIGMSLVFLTIGLTYAAYFVASPRKSTSHAAHTPPADSNSSHTQRSSATKKKLDDPSRLYVYAGTHLFKTEKLEYDIGTFTTLQNPFIIHATAFNGTPIPATSVNAVMVDINTHKAVYLQGVITNGVADMQPISSMGELRPGIYTVFLSATIEGSDEKLTAPMEIQIK